MRADLNLFADGAPLRLGDRLGKGGEGEVFALADVSDMAAKLYHAERAADREAKVAAMLAAVPGDDGLVAFPTAAITDGTGAFRGFVMHRVDGAEPLHDLYAPGARRERFPEADYRFLLRVAANAARAVAAVHQAGHVIGDLNHSGFLIRPNGLVAIIDADSFQVEAEGTIHRCTVGVPEYTPPELQDVRLADVDRTAEHDAFGLAVIIFQLLFFGRHPFSGVVPEGRITVPEAISQGAFAYSVVRPGALKPPPGTMALTDQPRAIAALFERAFGPAPEDRPTALDWVSALTTAEASLRPCLSAVRHDYWLKAETCPICRIERDGAQPLFPWQPPAFALADIVPPTLSDDAMDALRQQLNELVPPNPLILNLPQRPPPPDFTPPPRSRWPEIARITGGAVMIILCVIHAVLIPQNWLLSMPPLIAGGVLIRGGLRRDRAAQQDLLNLDSTLSRRLTDMQANADLDGAALTHAKAIALVETRAALPNTFRASARARAETRVVAARRDRLNDTPVANLRATPEDVEALHAVGLKTASDLLDAAPADVPLDDTRYQALADASRDILNALSVDRIVADVIAEVEADNSAALAADARQLDGSIDETMKSLVRLMDTITLTTDVADPRSIELIEKRERLVREVELVGGTPPAPPLPQPRHWRSETLRRIREFADAPNGPQ